jgi:hypothetical protein
MLALAMLRLFPCLSLILLACASNPPAKSADAPASDEAGEAAPTEAGNADSAKEDAPSAEASKESAPTAPASQEDAQQVLQLVIDDDALSAYLHLDKPDRFPLRIGGSALPQGLELTKATKPVIIVTELDKEKKPVIVFTEIKIAGDDASVRYRYDAEKVRGSSTLKRRDGHWVLTQSRVTEH